YGALSPSNPQGSALGEVVQLIAKEVEGQQVGYCAFSEKMRAGPVIRGLSSFKQKMSQGVWGAVIRMPAAISQMIGVEKSNRRAFVPGGFFMAPRLAADFHKEFQMAAIPSPSQVNSTATVTVGCKL